MICAAVNNYKVRIIEILSMDFLFATRISQCLVLECWTELLYSVLITKKFLRFPLKFPFTWYSLASGKKLYYRAITFGFMEVKETNEIHRIESLWTKMDVMLQNSTCQITI